MESTGSGYGKLVVCGDYAVLEGAPALVLAVDRQACARITSVPESGLLRVNAPDIGVLSAQGRFAGSKVEWDGPGLHERLRLVDSVLEHFAPDIVASRSLIVHIDTRAFLAADGVAKLGLGSSAAVTVALAKGLAQATDTTTPTLEQLVAMHRRAQGGRGSGIDVAAALRGGLLCCRNHDERLDVVDVDWPDGLYWRAIWTGRSASTAAALAQLATWRGEFPRAFRECMDDLKRTAECVAASAASGAACDMLAGLGDYARLLDRLGQASGIDIFSAEHRQLAALAARHGVVYKTSGAGIGDVGLALAGDPEALDALAQKASRAGFPVQLHSPAPTPK